MTSESEVARVLLSRILLEEFGLTARVGCLRVELGEAPDAKGLQRYGTIPYMAT